MRGRSLNLRFVALLVCLLVLYPTLFASFIHSSSFSDGLRTTFLLFKQPLFAVLAFTLFFLFAKSGRDGEKLGTVPQKRGQSPISPASGWQEFLGFFLAGTLCLGLATYTQLDLNRILNEGVTVGKKVQWDSHRWGVFPLLSETDPIGEQYQWVRTPDQRLMKTVPGLSAKADVPGTFLRGSKKEPGTFSPEVTASEKKPGTFLLKWYAIWRDGNGNGVLDDRIWLTVNGERYEVTREYQTIPANTAAILELEILSSVILSEVPTALLGAKSSSGDEAKNLVFPITSSKTRFFGLRPQNDKISVDVILYKESGADAVGWVAGATYLLGQTREWEMENGKWGQTPFMEALVWMDQPNGPIYSFLFKAGYLLRWVGMILLFFAFFGWRWSFSFARRSPVLTAVSFLYAPLILLLGFGLRQSWPWLAQGIGWSLYGLLHFGFKPFINIPDASHVFVGTQTFSVNIADTCSGIESVGLFTGIYAGLILFNWRSLRFSRALILIIPGLLGMYLVNALRVYLLFLIGLIAGNSALDLFHTYLGMFVFVLYFLFFWQVSQRWISRDGARINIGKLRVAPSIVSGLMVVFLLTGYEMTNPTEKTVAVVTYDYYCAADDTPYCGGGGATSCGAYVAGKQECPVGYTWGPEPACMTSCLTCGDPFEGWYTANCIAVPEFPLFFPALLSLCTTVLGFGRKRQC